MTELSPYMGAQGRLVEWAEAAQAAKSLADVLSATAFVPVHFRGKPAEAMAAILLGDQLGLAPLAALSAVYVIGGTPAMYTRTKVALLLARGHRVWTVKESDTEVTVRGLRAGVPEGQAETVTWSLERAATAGLLRNPNYKTNPRAMLWARAAGEVCNRIAPDVLLGLPDAPAEELAAEEGGPGGSVTVQRTGGGQWQDPRGATVTPASDNGRTHPGPEPHGIPTAPITAPVVDRELPPAPEAPPDPEPAAEAPPADPDPDPISPAQLRMIHALYGSLGYTDRTDYLNDISSAVGRIVTTSKELTKAEAHHVIDALVKAKAAQDGDGG